MKIHILTAHYTPQIHPRAFRASELALEFKRMGHDVKISNLTFIDGFDYNQYTAQTGISIDNLNLYHHSLDEALTSTKKTFLKRFKEFVSEYFFAGRLLFYSKRISNEINIAEDTDLLIALSTPFMDILGLSKYIKKTGAKVNFVSIADSGDPFYFSKQYKKAPWFYLIEKNAYKQFDYLTIPVESAIPSYERLIPKSKIRIIPQAFNLNNVRLFKGEISKKIKFAYAGVFYWDIRNPEFLFKYLNGLECDFEFHIFMRYADSKLHDVLSCFPKLKDKVILKLSVPREDLIYELSSMHFLININNVSNTQVPSKIIDYRISNRPILSFNSTDFKQESFERFMNGNYEDQLLVDITKYDIKNVAQQFIELCKSN